MNRLSSALAASTFFLTAHLMGDVPSAHDPSRGPMYQSYAEHYDGLYQRKAYRQEVEFLHRLLSRASAASVLDVGCGTGSHMKELEAMGYDCTGIDLNTEMLAVAKKKVRGTVMQGDMRDFDLGCMYDAITCMFAVFNHNLTDADALSTLQQMHAHLKPGGLLIVDLYNPRDSGRKTDQSEGVSRTMEWQWDGSDPIVHSAVTLSQDGQQEIHHLPLRFFPLESLPSLFESAGFTDIQLLSDYGKEKATPRSHNVIVTAWRKAA